MQKDHRENDEADPLGRGKRPQKPAVCITAQELVQKANDRIRSHPHPNELAMQSALQIKAQQHDEKHGFARGLEKLNGETRHAVCHFGGAVVVDEPDVALYPKATARQEAANPTEHVEQGNTHRKHIEIVIPFATGPFQPNDQAGKGAEEPTVENHSPEFLQQHGDDLTWGPVLVGSTQSVHDVSQIGYAEQDMGAEETPNGHEQDAVEKLKGRMTALAAQGVACEDDGNDAEGGHQAVSRKVHVRDVEVGNHDSATRFASVC